MVKKIGSFIIGTVLALSMPFAVVNAYYTDGGDLGTTYGSYNVGIGGTQSTYSRPYATLTSANNAYLRIYNISLILNGSVTAIPSVAESNSTLCEWTQTYAPGAVTRIQCSFENFSTNFGSWTGSAWYQN